MNNADWSTYVSTSTTTYTTCITSFITTSYPVTIDLTIISWETSYITTVQTLTSKAYISVAKTIEGPTKAVETPGPTKEVTKDVTKEISVPGPVETIRETIRTTDWSTYRTTEVSTSITTYSTIFTSYITSWYLTTYTEPGTTYTSWETTVITSLIPTTMTERVSFTQTVEKTIQTPGPTQTTERTIETPGPASERTIEITKISIETRLSVETQLSYITTTSISTTTLISPTTMTSYVPTTVPIYVTLPGTTYTSWITSFVTTEVVRTTTVVSSFPVTTIIPGPTVTVPTIIRTTETQLSVQTSYATTERVVTLTSWITSYIPTTSTVPGATITLSGSVVTQPASTVTSYITFYISAIFISTTTLIVPGPASIQTVPEPNISISPTDSSSLPASISCTSFCHINVTATRLRYPGKVVVATTTLPLVTVDVYTDDAGNGVSSITRTNSLPPSTPTITWDFSGVVLTWPTVYAAYATFSRISVEAIGSQCTSKTVSLNLPSPTDYTSLIIPENEIPNPSYVAPTVVEYLNSLPTVLAQLGGPIRKACDPIVGSLGEDNTESLGDITAAYTVFEPDATRTNSAPTAEAVVTPIVSESTTATTEPTSATITSASSPQQISSRNTLSSSYSSFPSSSAVRESPSRLTQPVSSQISAQSTSTVSSQSIAPPLNSTAESSLGPTSSIIVPVPSSPSVASSPSTGAPVSFAPISVSSSAQGISSEETEDLRSSTAEPGTSSNTASPPPPPPYTQSSTRTTTSPDDTISSIRPSSSPSRFTGGAPLPTVIAGWLMGAAGVGLGLF